MLSAKIMGYLVLSFFWKAGNKQFQLYCIPSKASTTSPMHYSDVCIKVKAILCGDLESFASKISYWHRKLKSKIDM